MLSSSSVLSMRIDGTDGPAARSRAPSPPDTGSEEHAGTVRLRARRRARLGLGSGLVIGLGLGLGFGTPARCDRQEAGRPGGQGGPASPEPAAVQKRITPARARGRLAARHSEALLQGSGAGARSTPRPLAAAACRGENSSTREPATLEKYVHPQVTRKVSEGLLRLHRGCAQKRAHRDHADSVAGGARDPARRSCIPVRA